MARLPLVSPLDRALFLKAQPYLTGLAPRGIAALAEYTEERSFAKDDVVFREGEIPEYLYFLSSGAVHIEYPGGGYELEAPGGVGLTEFLARSDQAPRVRATRPTLALSLRVDRLVQLLEDDFALYETFGSGLSKAMGEVLADLPPEERSEAGFGPEVQRETAATLDLVQRIARARHAPFFAGSSLTVMTQLLRFQEPRLLAAGETLFRRGTGFDSLALVLDGDFETTDASGGATPQPAGAVLGWWEVFGRGLRWETATAKTPARVLEIDRALFSDVLEDHFDFARGYLAKMCRRLIALRRVRSNRLLEAAQDERPEPSPSALDSESPGRQASSSTGSGKSSNGNGMRDSL